MAANCIKKMYFIGGLPAEEALQQINEKGYASPFQTDSRKVIKVGVEFSAEARNVKRWLAGK